MRQTLLFGGLESIAHNVNRKANDLAFYEFGNVYFFNPEAGQTDGNTLAPFSEGARLALWMTGNSRTGNWARPAEEATFFDLKAMVANIFARLGITEKELSWEKLTGNDIFSAALEIRTRSGKTLVKPGLLPKQCWPNATSSNLWPTPSSTGTHW